MKVAFVGDIHCSDSGPRSRVDNYLETVMRKIIQVARENNKIVFLGDFLEKKVLSTENYVVFIKFFKKMQERGREFYLIPGNHDLYYGQEESIARTGLGVFLVAGVIKIIEKEEWEGFLVERIKLGGGISKTSRENSILLGHCYLDNPYGGKEQGITKGQVEEGGYKYVILGHEHEKKEPEKVGKSLVLRPGSLLRTSSHEYNLRRTPGYYQFTLLNGVEEYSYKEIEVEDIAKVFNSNVLDKQLKFLDLDSVQDLVKKIMESGALYKLTMGECLRRINAPPLVVEYLQKGFGDLGLEF